MCGIFCSIHSSSCDPVTVEKSIELCKDPILRRGPDNFQQLSIIEDDIKCHFMASVRWTQGTNLTPQPLQDEDGNILLWNGDVYSFNSEGNNETIPPSTESDSKQVLSMFSENGVQKTLKQIQGPYSFIFYNKKNKQLWFGKDPIGRHSLLLKVTKFCMIVTSVANKSISNIEEVSNTHITCLDITSSNYSEDLKEFKWKNHNLPICPILKSYHPKTPSQDISPCEDIYLFFNKLKDEIDKSELMKQINQLKYYKNNIEQLTKLLKQSIEKRIQTQPKHCLNCKISCDHCKTGVLFSGGIDSTVIALLANEFIPSSEPIDLLNVAFEKNQNFNVPDRITGLSSLKEIQNLCPNRQWNFVQINITRNELEKKRNSHIKDIIYPLDTVLDDSLGCAVWFAARGQGVLNDCDYTSPARVLLLGMGADEMLGGYARHRQILKYCSKDWSALRAQLELETMNISKRNLGRDNRVVCDNGRQPRTPFLDENVVAFLINLSSWERCWITDDLPPSVGDKLLLRLVAWNLGLTTASTLPKRALQFGSRIADSREKGNAVCERL